MFCAECVVLNVCLCVNVGPTYLHIVPQCVWVYTCVCVCVCVCVSVWSCVCVLWCGVCIWLWLVVCMRAHVGFFVCMRERMFSLNNVSVCPLKGSVKNI